MAIGSYYQFRTFRVVKLSNDKEITYNLDCENGYNDWRFSTDIVKAWKVPNHTGFWFETVNGSIYTCGRYQPIPSTKIVDDYCRINGFTNKQILSNDEFLTKYIMEIKND